MQVYTFNLLHITFAPPLCRFTHLTYYTLAVPYLGEGLHMLAVPYLGEGLHMLAVPYLGEGLYM